MLKLGLNLTAAALRPVGEALPPPPPPPPPTYAVEAMVIEGDSITSTTPSVYSSGFYSYRFEDATPGTAIEVRAQASRTIGSAANLNDNGNTLMGNVAEDMAYSPDLVTIMIGANDLAGGIDAEAYRTQMANYYTAVKAEKADCRIAWSAPFRYNPDNQHPNYATFTARRDELVSTARDPAVWGQFADYYMPLAEHPDWQESPSISPSLWGDSVHPTGFDMSPAHAGGQNRLYDQYKAVLDTLIDSARETSTSPYEAVWPNYEADLTTDTLVTRRLILSGLAHTGVPGDVAVTGDGNPGVRVNSAGSFGSSAGMTHLYNGDVVDVELTTSDSFETVTTISLTIAGETRAIDFTTAANLAPATYVHGGKDESFQSSSALLTTTKSFSAGTPLIQLWVNNPVVSVTVAGQACVRRLRSFRAETRGFEVWEGPDLPAGDHEIIVSYTGGTTHRFLAWGTLQGASFMSSGGQSATALPPHQSQPFLTPDWGTTPANGLALCYLGRENSDAVAASGSTSLLDLGTTIYQSSHFGLVIAQQTDDGPGNFNAPFGRRLSGYVLYGAG